MKKILIIILGSLLLFTVVTACQPTTDEVPDPRTTDQYSFDKSIRDLSKKHDKKLSFSYDPEKSFDLYLAHFLMSSSHAYTQWSHATESNFYVPEYCAKKIENDHEEYDLVYFKPKFAEQLKFIVLTRLNN